MPGIALLGAAGRTGALVIDEALARGLPVRALARAPGRVPARDGLTVVLGDATDAAALASLLRGADAVVSTLGTRGLPDGNLHVRVMPVLVAAMRDAGICRYAALSSTAAVLPGDDPSWARAAFLAAMRLALPRYAADKAAEVDAVVALEWTLLRAGRLHDGEAGGLRISPRRWLGPAPPTSRAAVARELVEAVVDGRWVGEGPFVGDG
jgi:uncharacterized protein YbjT (DUF2867 family)